MNHHFISATLFLRELRAREIQPRLSLAALRGTRLDPLRGLNLSRLSGNPA
jgi:hypothetical protein